jgi:hypothetical protein
VEAFSMITQAELKEILHYDPETGVFRWRHARKNNQIKPWGVAGSRYSKDYSRIEINNKAYKAHRLAWLYMTGCWPENDIDHIDGDILNNSWSNLRPATKKQNAENRKLPSNNTSGFKGVGWNSHSQKWYAQINHNNKKIHLGRFADAEEAAKVIASKRAELYTHYTGRDQVNTFG